MWYVHEIVYCIVYSTVLYIIKIIIEVPLIVKIPKVGTGPLIRAAELSGIWNLNLMEGGGPY